ncbi:MULTISPECIES: ABC transporter permease [Pseudomonas]|uniref:ABC transporter permease subunit n=1 Tax=Pseudomonas gingeri TaxID=117681 RepID=A0A7Y7WE11_9PSED|nr:MULTISPECIES: ABC transporter permease subunit [Pseudomonas]MCU1740561.1 ABC transporter permease subunit [Pseudomonas sp. 20S_6.2_Bac1]NWB47680.1 ABC transporter permease subunit [Pseudomonas gingeri]
MLSDYISSVLSAGWITFQLALTSLALAVVLGLAGALCKRSEHRTLRVLAEIYTTLVRGIPDLVLMLLMFYSLPALLNQWIGAAGGRYNVDPSPFLSGALTLGVIFGAYMTETFRGALEGIPAGQLEAAQAYGLGRVKTLRSIILPQMVRLALPGFTNNWLVLVKATALVSLIGLQDIMFRAKGAAEATGKPFTFYLLAGGFYLLIAVLSLALVGWLGKRYSQGVRELAR